MRYQKKICGNISNTVISQVEMNDLFEKYILNSSDSVALPCENNFYSSACATLAIKIKLY